MPTFVNTPEKGVNKPQFPRNPQPGVNVHPDSRLAQPPTPEAHQGQHPFLAGHGFNGDIQSFNRRVQLAHDGYSNAFQKEPSPGVVWDVAMTPNVEDSQITSLFNVPTNQRDTKAQQYHLESQHDGNAVHVREDGKVQPTNLLTAWRQKQQMEHNHPQEPLYPNAKVLSVKEFHKQYPLLADGYTGMIPYGSQFWQDVGESTNNPAKFQQKLGYLTPKQSLQVATQAQDATLSQQGQAAAIINYGTQSNIGSKAVKGAMAADAVKTRSDAVNRNITRQKWLVAHDPSGLFRGLVPNGIFDRQWMTAYDQWSRTPGAAYLAMQGVAKQNYFAPTPAGIKAMSEAAKTKERMANAASGWSQKWQVEATPLRFFDKTGSPMGRSILSAHNDAALLKDFWKYEDTGTSSLWPIAMLQGGFRFAKLGFDSLSGGFNQVTADANGFTTTLGNAITGIDQGKNTKQIAAAFHKAVEENPSWVNVLGFGKIPAKDTSTWWDQGGNFILGTLIAMNMSGPGYWKMGEETPLEQVQSSRFVKLLTNVAHADLKSGDLVRASNWLGPRDADTFIAAVEKDVRNGELKRDEFHNLVTKYYKDGKVEYKGKQIGGGLNEGILPLLKTDKLPKSMTKVTLAQLAPKLRAGMDNFEMQALAHGGRFGKASEAFVRSMRGMFGLASPDEKMVSIFAPKLPNQLESFLTNHGLMDRNEIQATANKFIMARAHENIPEMESILRDANARYRVKFPKGASGFGEDNEFEKLLETQNLTHFRFAGGQLPEGKDIWEKAQIAASKANQMFNVAGYYWRRTILATGPGLFYKHLSRDSIAALLGGMKFKATEDMANAMQVFDQVARENPEIRRLHAATRGSVRGADLSYMLAHNYSARGTFKLMEEISQNGKASTELSTKAAMHLRGMVMSKMYAPFKEALDTGNMDSMVKTIMENPEFRTILNENSDISKQLEAIEHYGERSGGTQAGDYGVETWALRNMMKRQLVRKEATNYAKAVFDEYKAVIDEGKAQGIPDVLSVVDDAHWKNPGMADKAIAKFLKENEVNVEVKGGAPQPRGWFDKSTANLVSAYMKPNKFFRGQLFDSAFAENFSTMLKMGYDPKAAAGEAVRLAEAQTMYHMLDFSNTLQFEQRFRGFLPFFTKHRLFVKWVAARIAQYPGIVMPISDISKHLDQYGRLNFTFMGSAMNLNVSRLMWLNSEDMPPIIPGAQLIPKAGLPGEFTRFDSIIGMWFHAVQSHWNYNQVVKHMDPYSVQRLDKYMAIFAIHYRMAHGESAPVPEQEALKYAMIRQGWSGGVTGNLLVNNSFMSPVTFSEPQTPGKIHALDTQYSKLFNQNPAKAKAFLDKHPEVGLGWGLTENFDLYNHVTQYWGLYDKLHSDYMKVEKRFSDQVLAGKPMSAADYEKVHEAQTKYDQGIQQLLVQDAKGWTQNAGGYAPGQVSGAGEITNYGPWGTLFLHDPIGSVNRLIKQFGAKNFTTADLHNIYGKYTEMLQYNIDHAKMLKADSQTVSNWYAELRRVEGTYKVTAKPTLWQAYKTDYSKYQSTLAKYRDKARQETGYARTVTDYQMRQFIVDSLERPYIKFDGQQVKVLPFSEYYLGTKTPQERSTAIWKDFVGFTSYSRLTYDERAQLGLATTPAIDHGWGVFNSWVAEYQQQTGKEASTSVRQGLAAQVNKQDPGFWRDYLIAHQPKAIILKYYTKGAFVGPYGDYWKEIVNAAVQVYDTNKRAWPDVAQQINTQIEDSWPQGFVKQYNAAGGSSLLSGLLTAWG